MKELKINVPEGYEIDRENSTFECIKFKPIEERWRDNNYHIDGCYIGSKSNIIEYSGRNIPNNYNVFATEKQAKSALAIARISQIMANDERFGGVITDEEWCNYNQSKWAISRKENHIHIDGRQVMYSFLAFHTEKQCDLFLEENEDLVKDYLMID